MTELKYTVLDYGGRLWGSGGGGGEVGDGNPLQYSCLENFVDTGAWWATVYGVAKSSIPLYMLQLINVRACVISCVQLFVTLFFRER